MKNGDKKKIIYRQTLSDGKRRFTVVVPVIVEMWNVNGKWEEVFPSEASAKIDRAIETQYPGWFHTCFKSPKQHCKACTRAKAKTLDKVEEFGKLPLP